MLSVRFVKQEQQRLADVERGTRISFIFARCRPTRSLFAAARLPLLNGDAAALGSMLIKKLIIIN